MVQYSNTDIWGSLRRFKMLFSLYSFLFSGAVTTMSGASGFPNSNLCLLNGMMCCVLFHFLIPILWSRKCFQKAEVIVGSTHFFFFLLRAHSLTQHFDQCLQRLIQTFVHFFIYHFGTSLLAPVTSSRLEMPYLTLNNTQSLNYLFGLR